MSKRLHWDAGEESPTFPTFLCLLLEPVTPKMLGVPSVLRFLLSFVCLCCCSVTNLCLTLFDPMDCSTPGFPVLHYLPEFAQTHVDWVHDAIQPSHPLSSPSPPALNLSQHQGLFQWVGSSRQVAKVLELQLQRVCLWTPVLTRCMISCPCLHFSSYLPAATDRIQPSNTPEPVSSTWGSSEIAACPPPPTADDPSALPSPIPSPSSIGSSSCLLPSLWIFFDTCMPAVVLPFPRYCKIKKVPSIFCVFVILFVWKVLYKTYYSTVLYSQCVSWVLLT